MSSPSTIRAVAKTNFEAAASDFARSPNPDHWDELLRAAFAHQQAQHLEATDLLPGAWLMSQYDRFEAEKKEILR